MNYDYSVIDSLCVNVLLQIDDGKHILVEQILVLHLFCHLSEEVDDNLNVDSKVNVKGGVYDICGDNDTITKALYKRRQTFLSLDSLRQKPNPKFPKPPKSNKPKLACPAFPAPQVPGQDGVHLVEQRPLAQSPSCDFSFQT